MQPTHLLYIEDFTILQNEASVIDVIQENDKDVVILDSTIFYAQGGGQPFDRGIMQNDSGKFVVEEVRFVEGIVKHIGQFESGSFSTSEKVTCIVDAERRKLNSRLHSAGHAVDWAVQQLQLPWTPGKGYHFPNGPYVEYKGSIGELDKEQLKEKMEEQCAKFIAEDRPAELRFMDKEKMHEVCHFVPEFLPEGKPARVVMFGDFGVPCGGTHVSSLKEIGQMIIRKIKVKGTTIQVAYDVNR